MKDNSVNKLQIYYELAMSVGVHHDLNKMLKHALLTYLRKLNCISAIIYKSNYEKEDEIQNTIVFSIPIQKIVTRNYSNIIDRFPSTLSVKKYAEFVNSLPLTNTFDEHHYYHIMKLGPYGLMVLIKNDRELDKDVLLTLNQINHMLGMACIACENNRYLTENNEQYKSLFKDNKSKMMLFDPNSTRIVDANPSSLEFFGYSREKLLQMYVSQISNIPEIRMEKEIGKILSNIKNSFKLRARLANGEKRDVKIHCSVIKFSDKSFIHVIIYDITQQLKAEKDLIKAKEKAEESDKLKTAFLANMSHEIRTPLNAIMGFTELFFDESIKEQKRKSFAQEIIKNGKKLVNLIDDIIDISKIQTGNVDYKPEKININHLLDLLFKEFNNQFKEKNLILKLYKESDDTKMFSVTDRNKLNQVLKTLLDNALKFTLKGEVNFGYTVKTNVLEFYVKDTGIGIHEKFHQSIFEPFRQGDLKLTRKYGGTGLGLAISKKMIEMLGGKIWILSDSKRGTTFYFTLPFQNTNR